MTTLRQPHTFQTASGWQGTLRRVVAQDRDKLVHFLQQLSEQTRKQRYMTNGSWPIELLEREAERMVRGQGSPSVCLIITTQQAGREEIIAVGELLTTADNPTWAEVAFVVRDDFQNHGIGSLLADHIAAIAQTRGIATLCVNTKAANAPMLHLVRRLGHIASRAMGYGELQLNITPLMTAAP